MMRNSQCFGPDGARSPSPKAAPGRRTPTLSIIALLLVHTLSPALAAPPTLDAIFPPGAQAGKKIDATLDGKFDPWPCEIWCSDPALVFEPDKEKKGQVSITVPETVSPGPVLIRLHNGEGASDLRTFVIGSLPEYNADPKHAASLHDPEPVDTFPVTINGRLDQREDIDIYRVSLKAGDRLIASLNGYALRSGIDPFLHLYDPNGVQIALGNDNGRNLDPLLVHEIKKSGDYLVAIMAYISPPGSDIRFTGSKKAVYRLTLTGDPAALPAVPSDDSIPDALAPPFDLVATIGEGGESDRYTFPAKKGESFLVKVGAQEFGSPLDPVLVVTDPQGKTLRTIDDAGKTTRDAEYLVKAGADGEYTATVSDRFRKGSPSHRYRIAVAAPKPELSATVDKSSYVVDTGKDVELKVKLVRSNGHDAPLEMKIDGLPAGVTFEEPEIPAKSATVTLKLAAAADAAPASGPFEIRLVETVAGNPESRTVPFSFQDDDARGPYLVDSVDQVWLTVKEAKK